MKKTFSVYETEQDAISAMKAMRKRKYSVTYSEFWKSWVVWYNK